MKRKVTVIFISCLIPIILISTGYGAWEKKLIITGSIKVVKPVPQTTPNEEVKIDAPLVQTEPVDTQQPNQDSTTSNVDSVNPDTTTTSETPTTTETPQVTEPLPGQSSDPNSTAAETNTSETTTTDTTTQSSDVAPTN